MCSEIIPQKIECREFPATEIMIRKTEIDAIELTEQEKFCAIQEAKIKKWFEINSDGHYKKLEDRSKTGKITFK